MASQLKYWVCKNTKKTFIIGHQEIKAIVDVISLNYDSYLKRGLIINVNGNRLVPLFDHIVICGHLCALLNSLGRGAFGEVFKAYDYNISKFVAVKSQSSQYAGMITRQFEATRRNGIGLIDPSCNVGPCFLRNGRGYFIIPLADMNYINWSARKMASGDYKAILQSLIKIGKDLQRLHLQGNVHMDLKLDNILSVEDTVCLADFGKVEKEGKIIPSAEGCYLNYRQCDPNYFIEYSNNPFYKVDRTFDVYSFGILIKEISRRIRNSKLRLSLSNISKDATQYNTRERKPLGVIIGYLENLEKRH